jgi:hypothetical protein
LWSGAAVGGIDRLLAIAPRWERRQRADPRCNTLIATMIRNQANSVGSLILGALF